MHAVPHDPRSIEFEMKVLLVRHGEAVSETIDPNRSLSSRGQRQVEQIAAFLDDANVVFDRIMHSGKTRARQTADQLGRYLIPGIETEAVSGLNPEDSVNHFAEQVLEWTQNTIIVGHLPFLAKLVAQLIKGGDGSHPFILFTPATAICLERDEEGLWSIIWMIQPELLIEPD